MAYYFGITNSSGDIEETFVDLQRRFPEQKFSSPETNHELGSLGVVRVYRRENIDIQWPYTVRREYIENDNGVYREKVDLIEVTNPEMLARAESHMKNTADGVTPIILTSEISKDATFY